MGLLTFSLNLTLDGCIDHEEGIVDDETHAFFTRLMDDHGAMLWGRVTYEMMESYWPAVARGEVDAPPALREWAEKLEVKPKYVVSSTRADFPWTNSHRITGDLRSGVQALKDATPDGVLLGSGLLANELDQLDLIDEYRFLVHPRGDVDVIHQIDYVLISTIEYKTETVDMARQKRVAGGFQFRGGSTINPGFSLATSGGIRFGLNGEELPGIIKVKKGTTQTISRFSGHLGIRESIGYTPGFIGIFPPSNPLASEYNTYYDNFSNFFVTDATADFADGYNDYKIQQRDMVAILTTPTNADPNKGYKLNPEQIQMLWDKI